MRELNIIKITDTIQGNGNLADIGSCVKVKCVVRFINARYLDSAQKYFVLEEAGEATGLVQGILGMRVGGKRIIEAPTRWWYGENANPCDVPSNVGLVFEVELLACVSPAVLPKPLIL